MTHLQASDLNCANRDKTKSFLWSMMRHPEDRAISHFAMNSLTMKVEPTAESFIYSLKNSMVAYLPNVQLLFLFPFYSLQIKEEDYSTYGQIVLNEFNFVGIYERLHESLVVLSMLMGVDVTDVLYDFESSRLSRCGTLERPAWVTPDVESYFKSTEWRQRDKGDYMLYNAVDKSLDLTIEKLGVQNVQEKLTQFSKLLHIGTTSARTMRDQDFGCGIQGLHPIQTPFADLKDLFWVNELSKEDRDFVSRPDFPTTVRKK